MKKIVTDPGPQESVTQNQWYITSFYRFLPITDPERYQLLLEQKAELENFIGLVILGAEGINSTLGFESLEKRELFKSYLKKDLLKTEIDFKDSVSHTRPFRRFQVKLRAEIVTVGSPDVVPLETHHRHLTPTEWNEVLKTDQGTVVIDTRNNYEVKIGTFKNALNPEIDQFTDFPDWVDRQKFAAEQKMLIFCTGGIRCEKGILELEKRGYKNVYQLEGGILNYLQQFPNDQFQGECFVFDNRVSLKQDLSPTEVYKFCPHCGQPAATPIHCQRCETDALICEDCLNIPVKKETSSKNCAHWWGLNPGKQGLRQIPVYQLKTSR